MFLRMRKMGNGSYRGHSPEGTKFVLDAKDVRASDGHWIDVDVYIERGLHNRLPGPANLLDEAAGPYAYLVRRKIPGTTHVLVRHGGFDTAPGSGAKFAVRNGTETVITPGRLLVGGVYIRDATVMPYGQKPPLIPGSVLVNAADLEAGLPVIKAVGLAEFEQTNEYLCKHNPQYLRYLRELEHLKTQAMNTCGARD